MRIKVHTDEGRIKFVYPVDERYIRTVAQLSEAVGRVLGVEANDNDGNESTSIKGNNLSRKRKNAGKSRAGDSSKSTTVSLSLDGFALLPSHAISAVLRDGDSIEAVVQVNPGNRHAAKKRRMLSHAVTVESSDESSEESDDELSSPTSEESSSDSAPDSSSVESDDSDSSIEHVSIIVVDSESEASDDVSVHEEEIPATPVVSDVRMREEKAPTESTSANDHQVMAPPMSLGRAKRKLIESMARNKETRVHHRFDLSSPEDAESGQPEKTKAEPIQPDAHVLASIVAESKKNERLKGKIGTASAESQHRLETSKASSSPKQPKQMKNKAASAEAPPKTANSQPLPQKSSISESPIIPAANKKLPPPSQNNERTPIKIQEPAPENSNKKKQPKKQLVSSTPKQPTPQNEQLELSSSKQTTVSTPSASSNLPPPRGVRTYVELYDDHPDAFTTPNTTPGGASSNGKRKRGLTKKQRAKQELSREQEFDSAKNTRDLNEDIGDLDYGDDGYGCNMSAANDSVSKSQPLTDGYTRVSKGTSDGGRNSGTGFERRSATGDSTKSTVTATLQAPTVKDYTTYPSLKKMPVPGSNIAYKLLHMSENYTPEISSYIESTVVSVNYSDGSLTVQSVVAPATPVTPVKHNQSQGREGVYYGDEDERWYDDDGDVDEGEYRKFDVGDVGEFVVVDEFNGVGDGLRTLMFADLIEPRVLPS
ncbi:hypothetical protein HDU80_006326 [Chytriomyces hyalinus]|nr:hypothetical protein HDU80_006326 [Chytriomyces hyalinus]